MSTTCEKLKRKLEKKIKNILIIFLFILFDFMFYYLLTLNVVFYKRNKKYLI